MTHPRVKHSASLAIWASTHQHVWFHPFNGTGRVFVQVTIPNGKSTWTTPSEASKRKKNNGNMSDNCYRASMSKWTLSNESYYYNWKLSERESNKFLERSNWNWNWRSTPSSSARVGQIIGGIKSTLIAHHAGDTFNPVNCIQYGFYCARTASFVIQINLETELHRPVRAKIVSNLNKSTYLNHHNKTYIQ